MLVTSASMNTAWRETMNILVQNSPKEKNFLEAQLEKVISSAKVTALLIYMLTAGVNFRIISRRYFSGVS